MIFVNMTNSRAELIFLTFLLLFGLVISANFTKPFGFFRESNSAQVCINMDQWHHYPELEKKHIPMPSYNYDPGAAPETQLYTSYLSFGYGWFALPYYVFSLFSLPVTAVAFRIFCVLWLGLTLVTAWLLLRQLTRNTVHGKELIFLTLLFYSFSAVVLWYHVNGYMQEIAVLPFSFLSWLIFARYQAKPSPVLMTVLWFLLFIGIQFDYLAFFNASLMSAWLFFNRKRWASLAPISAALAGIAYIVYHFSLWVGFETYMELMKGKFLNRTIGAEGLRIFPWLNCNFNLILFYIMGYGLSAFLFLYALVKRRVREPILWLMIVAALLHHLVFWGFSNEHDYSVLIMAFPIAFAVALLLQNLAPRVKIIITGGILLSNIFLYFLLHNLYRKPGIYKNPDFCYQTGLFIRMHLPLQEERVFLDTENKYYPQIEYYAKKPYYLAHDPGEAKALFQEAHLRGTAYFLTTERGEIVGVTELK